MKQLIVGLGEALWDCLPEGRKLGGAPANFAYHTGQFGHDSLAISAVGNDVLGKETLDEFGKKKCKVLDARGGLSDGNGTGRTRQ